MVIQLGSRAWVRGWVNCNIVYILWIPEEVDKQKIAPRTYPRLCSTYHVLFGTVLFQVLRTRYCEVLVVPGTVQVSQVPVYPDASIYSIHWQCSASSSIIKKKKKKKKKICLCIEIVVQAEPKAVSRSRVNSK